MSNQILRNVKKPTLLDQERAYLNTLVAVLFVNDVHPDGDTTALPYDPGPPPTRGVFDECADSGYAPVSPVFSTATLTGLDQAELVGPPITWTFTLSEGSFTIFGYLLIDPDDDEWVIAQYDDETPTITAAGQTYTYLPRKVMDAMA